MSGGTCQGTEPSGRFLGAYVETPTTGISLATQQSHTLHETDLRLRIQLLFRSLQQLIPIPGIESSNTR